jgi:hypothetical protein
VTAPTPAAGALYLASSRTVLGLGRVIVVCTALFELGLR